jgi:hypothetical protein
MKERRSELWGVMVQEPYNTLLKYRYATIKPTPALTFYTISCGRRRTRPEDTNPSGVIFQDDSYLTVYEKWSVADNRILEYEYHYQRPDGVWIRYDMDPEAASASHPEHHLQGRDLGSDIRLPTGKIKCEEVLQMIFEQFLMS